MKHSDKQRRYERRVYLILALTVLANLAFTGFRIWKCRHIGWGADIDFCASLITGKDDN